MEVKVLTSSNFAEEVLNSDVPVLVDFWATWCGPCKMLAPIVHEIAEESDGSYKVGKLDVDDEEDLAAQFGIASIPTLIVFKDGEPVKRSVGLKSKDDLLALLNV